jgi:hypothetical protein
LPTTIEIAASTASAGCHSLACGARATSKKRMKTAKAAALVATAMKLVIGEGAPSYTSGVHWWKGAIEVLKARPTAAMPIPTRISGSPSTLFWAMPWAIPLKSVEPVPP